jgi:hypothetical protein
MKLFKKLRNVFSSNTSQTSVSKHTENSLSPKQPFQRHDDGSLKNFKLYFCFSPIRFSKLNRSLLKKIGLEYKSLTIEFFFSNLFRFLTNSTTSHPSSDHYDSSSSSSLNTGGDCTNGLSTTLNGNALANGNSTLGHHIIYDESLNPIAIGKQKKNTNIN